MSAPSDDRTNPASPIQLNQATLTGDAPKSQEMAIAFQNLGGLLTLLICGGALGSWVQIQTTKLWQQPGQILRSTEPSELASQLQMLSWDLAIQLVFPLGMLVAIGVASYWIQTGIQIRPERVAPKISRLGPRWDQDIVAGLQKIMVRIPKLIAGVAFLGVLLWYQRDSFVALVHLSPDAFLKGVVGLVLRVSFQLAVLLFLFSLLDFTIEWFAQRRRWQMTDQEVRDEQRMENGNPTVQNNRRRRQWELSQRDP